VWRRAVIAPAARRASALWVGAAMFAAIAFGPTGARAQDLTAVAWQNPTVFAVIAVGWLTMFAPVARAIVRAPGATYLRSLPAPWLAAHAIAALALVALQAPWLALWVRGDGVRGLAVVVAGTPVIAAIAAWTPRARFARSPRWHSPTAAFVGIALRRRAGDAIVRALGLSALAGGAAAAIVARNDLTGTAAGTLGGAVLAVMLLPAVVGVLPAIIEAHAQSFWLAESLGAGASARRAVIATVAIVYACAALIALAPLALWRPDALAAAAPVWLATALAIGGIVARGCLGASTSAMPASRALQSAIAATALAVLLIGGFGIVGLAILAIAAALAVATASGAGGSR